MISSKEGSVLFVDDEPEVLELLREEFEPIIERIHLADTPECAENIVRSNPIDVAVLDLNLPKKDGLTLCRDLKAINPYLRVIFLTGTASRDHVRAALELGADSFIDKPFQFDHLILCIRSAIEKSKYESLIHDMMKHFILTNTKLDFQAFDKLSYLEKEKVVRAALGLGKLQLVKKTSIS